VQLDFEHKPILHRLNLRVERKQRMVVMGQSGAGKSTLLRLILGVLRPTEGTVFFEGRDLSRASRPQINAVRRKIGMVYQSSALISSLSVRDNLALPLEELTRKRRAEINHIVEDKLAMVGMEETGALMPSELSGGMRKRVAIARALVMEPELLLFDEPTTGLDPVLAAVIDELIVNLTEKAHATSIIVTHELSSAFRTATRIAMLYKGRIIEEDRPERFRSSHNPVVEQFIEGRTKGPIQ
jgi:phospholipid/cholesterol/gamma-HCH transport system ATP-binding protein